MADSTTLPDLAQLTPAYLSASERSSEEQSQRQREFLEAISPWFAEAGIAATIEALNAHGHKLEFISEADGGWLIYREPLPDGDHELQLSCLKDGSEIMLTTPMTDAAWERELQERKQNLSSTQRADEELRERFYARGGALFQKEPEDFNSLSISEQVLLALFTLDIEVNNGGFAQYFSNTGGQHAEKSIEGLQEIGATQIAELLRQATELVGPPFSDALTDRQMNALDANENAVGDLDDAYYASDEDLALLAMRWVLETDPGFEG